MAWEQSLEAFAFRRGSSHGGTSLRILYGLNRFMEEKIAGLDVRAAQEDLRRFIRTPREIEGWSKPFFQSLLPQIQYYTCKGA